ncbi:MAG: Uma2 family endonuclease [Treponema sp.]|jgi:Uma2 family endonuclease|nr:Uma2 family endonuclease [Treponema sp.]
MADSMETADFFGDGDENHDTKRTDLFNPQRRYEQIGNVIYMMSAPSEAHEAIIAEVFGQLWTYLNGKPCRVYGSNLGLDLKESIATVKELPSFRSYFKKNIKKGKEEEAFLLPDISVICGADKTRFSPHGYSGVPRMLIEVMSPSTAALDFEEKRSIYEAIGVGEYWVISDTQNVAAYVLQEGKFIKTLYHTEETILEVPVSVFPDLFIKFDKSKMEL